MLCKNCKHLKKIKLGDWSVRVFCGISSGDGVYKRTALGIMPWKNTVHPKCPLRKESEE